MRIVATTSLPAVERLQLERRTLVPKNVFRTQYLFGTVRPPLHWRLGIKPFQAEPFRLSYLRFNTRDWILKTRKAWEVNCYLLRLRSVSLSLSVIVILFQILFIDFLPRLLALSNKIFVLFRLRLNPIGVDKKSSRQINLKGSQQIKSFLEKSCTFKRRPANERSELWRNYVEGAPTVLHTSGSSLHEVQLTQSLEEWWWSNMGCRQVDQGRSWTARWSLYGSSNCLHAW